MNPSRQGYNKVIFLGRVRQLSELRRTPQGTAVCTFSLAIPEESQRSGEAKTGEVLIEVVVLGVLAEYCYTALNTEILVLVEGSLVQRRWKGPGGIAESKYEVAAYLVRPVSSS